MTSSASKAEKIKYSTARLAEAFAGSNPNVTVARSSVTKNLHGWLHEIIRKLVTGGPACDDELGFIAGLLLAPTSINTESSDLFLKRGIIAAVQYISMHQVLRRVQKEMIESGIVRELAAYAEVLRREATNKERGVVAQERKVILEAQKGLEDGAIQGPDTQYLLHKAAITVLSTRVSDAAVRYAGIYVGRPDIAEAVKAAAVSEGARVTALVAKGDVFMTRIPNPRVMKDALHLAMINLYKATQFMPACLKYVGVDTLSFSGMAVSELCSIISHIVANNFPGGLVSSIHTVGIAFTCTHSCPRDCKDRMIPICEFCHVHAQGRCGDSCVFDDNNVCEEHTSCDCVQRHHSTNSGEFTGPIWCSSCNDKVFHANSKVHALLGPACHTCGNHVSQLTCGDCKVVAEAAAAAKSKPRKTHKAEKKEKEAAEIPMPLLEKEFPDQFAAMADIQEQVIEKKVDLAKAACPDTMSDIQERCAVGKASRPPPLPPTVPASAISLLSISTLKAKAKREVIDVSSDTDDELTEEDYGSNSGWL